MSSQCTWFSSCNPQADTLDYSFLLIGLNIVAFCFFTFMLIGGTKDKFYIAISLFLDIFELVGCFSVITAYYTGLNWFYVVAIIVFIINFVRYAILAGFCMNVLTDLISDKDWPEEIAAARNIPMNIFICLCSLLYCLYFSLMIAYVSLVVACFQSFQLFESHGKIFELSSETVAFVCSWLLFGCDIVMCSFFIFLLIKKTKDSICAIVFFLCLDLFELMGCIAVITAHFTGIQWLYMVGIVIFAINALRYAVYVLFAVVAGFAMQQPADSEDEAALEEFSVAGMMCVLAGILLLSLILLFMCVIVINGSLLAYWASK